MIYFYTDDEANDIIQMKMTLSSKLVILNEKERSNIADGSNIVRT